MNRLARIFKHALQAFKGLCTNSNYVRLTLNDTGSVLIYSRITKKIKKFKSRSIFDSCSIEQVFTREDYKIPSSYHNTELQRFYDSKVERGAVPLIIDCGANIGASAVYFSEKYPEAKIIAIELDKENYNCLVENTSGNSSISPLHAAITNQGGMFQVENPEAGHNGYSSKRDECGDIQGKTVNQILLDNIDTVPFIIKIDIEGGEAALFTDNTDWCHKFQVIVIELHDWMLPGKSTSDNFMKLAVSENYERLINAENIWLYKKV